MISGLSMRSKAFLLVAALLVGPGVGFAVSQDMGDRRVHEWETDITAVQQHTIFVELVIEEDREGGVGQDITPFGAIVGLIKKCDRVAEETSQFDNAVLWFNDQFLFGDKQSRSGGDENASAPEDALGENPIGSQIWPGCWIPNGFAHATPSGEMEGAKTALAQQKRGIDTFEYDTSFYVTDPNGFSWLVDKYDYETMSTLPVDCDEAEDTPFADEPENTSVEEECESAEEECDSVEEKCEETKFEASKAYCEDIEEDGSGLFCRSGETGTMWTVHLQVDPQTESGIIDMAPWAKSNGEIRSGMPYNESVQNGSGIEYDFLLAIDVFNGPDEVHNNTTEKGADEGYSHPHNPEVSEDSPGHLHETQELDVFYNESAPAFTEENDYWDEHGAPPSVNEDCSNGTSGDPQRDAAVASRTFEVCDRVDDAGRYHQHDGSQTPRPTN